MRCFPAAAALSLLAALLAPLATAADFSGLWVASVSVNKVGEVNSRTSDSLFDLGVSAVRPDRTLVEAGSDNWSFYAGGTLPPTWRTSASFSNFSTAKAPLGYQAATGGYLAPTGGTVISFGSDPADKTTTSYFRKTFAAGNLSGLSSLKARVWFDDAVRIFLNGREIFSENAAADWKILSAGNYATGAAIRDDGSLWAWGWNYNGQVGDGSNTDRYLAVRVAPDSRFKAVAAGSLAAVAVKTDGTLWSWGHTGLSQLGDTNTPQQVGTDADWSAVAAGWDFSLALKSDGTLYGWGRNDYGVTGTGTTADVGTVTRIGGDADWKKVVAGGVHAAAIKTDGSLWLWGYNGRGQVGNSSTTTATAPARVGEAGSRWTDVSAGFAHTLAIKEDGTLWAWGAAGDGRLGLGGVSGDQITPQKVGTDNDWSMVAAGNRMSLALKEDGSLWGWGTDTFGTGAAAVTKSVPTRIGSQSDWVLLSVAPYNMGNGDRAMALRGGSRNELWGWGDNGSGRLGDGSNTTRPLMAALPSFFGARTESTEDPAVYRELELPASYLKVGENLIEAEVYGFGAANPDLYFDLELSGPAPPPDELIADKSAGWRYLETASEPPAGWQGPDFADSGWPGGPAPLGFGSATARTAVANNPTAYYRKTVSVDDPSAYGALQLRLLRDDGAAVYLNGVEILRSNLPAGTVTSATAPVQAVGPVEGDRYVTATIPLGTGLLRSGANVFAVEVHQHPAELAAPATLGALTPTGAEFPLRLLLHVDAAGKLRMLKEAIVMKDSADQQVIVADSALAGGYRGVAMRGGTLVGLRTSAVGYDFSGPTVTCSGGVGTPGNADCSFLLAAGHPTNPFLHRFHPDHDNLDESFSGAAAESFDLLRSMKLAFSSRYPANPDEAERPGASRPPQWGSTLLGGTFAETLSGLHKEKLSVSGWFTMKRISASAELKQ